MKSSIRIERVPKLDKVLRVTFAAIKKDLQETREEFLSLQEKVTSSLDLFGKRVDSEQARVLGEVRTKTSKLDDSFQQKTKKLDQDVKHIGKEVTAFVHKTNAKLTSWNEKIRKLDENSARATEIGKELKHVQYLRKELERISVLQKHINDVDERTVLKKDFDMHKQQIKKVFKEERTQVEKDLSTLEKTQQQGLQTHKEALDAHLKEGKTQLKAFQKDIQQQQQQLVKQVEKTQEDFQQALSDERKEVDTSLGQVDHRIDGLQEAIQSLEQRYQADLDAQMKELVKHTEKGFKDQEKELLKTITSSEKRMVKDIERVHSALRTLDFHAEKEIFKELAALRNAVEKIQGKKVEAVKEAPSKKPPKEGFFKKVVDFLIEDVEEDEHTTLQEFDKKKGDTFKIKELEDLKE